MLLVQYCRLADFEQRNVEKMFFLKKNLCRRVQHIGLFHEMLALFLHNREPGTLLCSEIEKIGA